MAEAIGDIAGLKSSGCSKSRELVYEFPFWYFTNEVCFEYQHVMISPRLPSVKKELTERSASVYIPVVPHKAVAEVSRIGNV